MRTIWVFAHKKQVKLLVTSDLLWVVCRKSEAICCCCSCFVSLDWQQQQQQTKSEKLLNISFCLCEHQAKRAVKEEAKRLLIQLDSIEFNLAPEAEKIPIARAQFYGQILSKRGNKKKPTNESRCARQTLLSAFCGQINFFFKCSSSESEMGSEKSSSSSSSKVEERTFIRSLVS